VARLERDETKGECREHETSDQAQLEKDRGKERGGFRRTRVWLSLAALLLVIAVAAVLMSAVRTRIAGRSAALEIADVSSERLLALGSVVGLAAPFETHAWLGIPYAKPPVDDLRWRAPLPPDAWADTLDALAFASSCARPGWASATYGSASDESVVGSEDCLYLNLWAPRAEPDTVVAGAALLPVMVWLAGDDDGFGAAAPRRRDGARLAGSQGVVVVTFGHRLGPFGSFSHPALRGREGAIASGNFGILDQIRALEWIRDHISEFGGDPGNVTLFGGATGGTRVMALLLAPAARGLFQRAIVQSGSTDSVGVAEAEHALDDELPGHRHSSREVVAALLEAAGVVPDRAAARRYADELPDDELVGFLLGRSSREILEVYRDERAPTRLDLPRRIRDGVVLPKGDWLEVLRAGRYNAVPVVLGSTRDEAKRAFSRDEEYVRRPFPGIWRLRDPDRYERVTRYHSDLRRLRAVDGPAAAMVASGATNVFAYRFDWDEEPARFGSDLGTLLGAAGGLEIPFVFGDFDLGSPLLNRMIFADETGPARELLSSRMMGYWAEFARRGRPGRGGRDDLPEWLPWVDGDRASSNLLILDTEEGGGIRLSQTKLSRALILAAVDAESELEESEKCAIFHELFGRPPDWNPEEIRRMGRAGCAERPPPAL
jgi:para-nitrobenzyl esterase